MTEKVEFRQVRRRKVGGIWRYLICSNFSRGKRQRVERNTSRAVKVLE